MNILGNDNINTTGKLKITLEDICTGEKEVFNYDNLIVTVCKTMIARRLAGVGNDCNITYCAVGTNATAPVVGNTKLGTELDRVAVTSISNSSNVVSVISFFGASDANGTLTEIGHFGEAASATTDSGTMINHAVIGITKTSAKTMTTEWSFTIT
jgi:hypothetical protein